jgi:hypothetical protein
LAGLGSPESGTIAKTLFSSSSATCFEIFMLILNFKKEVKFLCCLIVNTKIILIPSFFGGRRVWKPFFRFAGAFLFDEKMRHTVLRMQSSGPFKGIDRPFGWKVESMGHSIRTGKLEAQLLFKSHFKGPSSQDQQKTFRRRLITF